MIQKQVPPEIQDYEEDVFYGLGWKQLLYGAGAIVIAIIAFSIFDKIFIRTAAIVFTSIVSMPFAILGFFYFQGLSAISAMKVLYRWIKTPKNIYKLPGVKDRK